MTGRLRRTRAIAGAAVDDDWRFTKVYLRQAGRWQAVVSAAKDLAHAVHRARRRRPEIVVTDMLMAEGDGWQLLAALKADPDGYS